MGVWCVESVVCAQKVTRSLHVGSFWNLGHKCTFSLYLQLAIRRTQRNVTIFTAMNTSVVRGNPTPPHGISNKLH